MTYAQSEAEMFEQLSRAGYSADDQRTIRAAYELTVRLYPTLKSGDRTQIEHVVGTASLLAALHVPGAIVAAALIHNVYENGDFGGGATGMTDGHRREVVAAVGDRVEAHVRRFGTIKVSARSSETSAAVLDPLDRDVLLIAVVECFEHCLHHEYQSMTAERMASHAEQLGYPSLAADIRKLGRNAL